MWLYNRSKTCYCLDKASSARTHVEYVHQALYGFLHVITRTQSCLKTVSSNFGSSQFCFDPTSWGHHGVKSIEWTHKFGNHTGSLCSVLLILHVYTTTCIHYYVVALKFQQATPIHINTDQAHWYCKMIIMIDHSSALGKMSATYFSNLYFSFYLSTYNSCSCQCD